MEKETFECGLLCYWSLPDATELSNASYASGNSLSSTPMVWSDFRLGLASMKPMVQGRAWPKEIEG